MKNFLSIIYPVSDFLYLLQLEEYQTKRYFKTTKRFWWKRNIQKRDKLVYTMRVKLILFIALPFCLTTPPLTPLWIGISNMIVYPIFYWLKSRLVHKAADHFKRKNKFTKVIAIAGSYGKTTTKNYIYELIKYNYKTQMIPGNINTPAGIANWILKNFDPKNEYLLVEVDTYGIGEIKQSISITPPDIAILTNVGDQHLERFGSKANLKRALSEIFTFAKPGATKIKGNRSNIEYAIQIARTLHIPADIMNDTAAKLKKPDRRGNIIIINNFEVIDESYNISLTTAKATIHNATDIATKRKKKLIVISAGIPELGEENKTGNFELGEILAHNTEKIILLKSVFYKDVLNNSPKFILANNLAEAWEKLMKLDPKKYIILMQPELNDLYY